MVGWLGRLLGGVLLLLGGWNASAAAAAVSITDSLGRSVTLPRPAQRIVSLAPHLTDTVIALGERQRLVGVIAEDAVGQQPKGLPIVARVGALDYEAIRASRPDLILAWQGGMAPERLRPLTALGIPVVWLAADSLAQVTADIVTVARLLGHEPAGRQLAGRLVQRLQTWQAQSPRRPPLRVFLPVWHQPLMTLRGDHLVAEALRLCGAEPLMPSHGPLAPTVSVEWVVAQRPQAILFDAREQSEASVRAYWARWPQLPAVQQRQLHALDLHHLTRPGPGFVDGVDALCRRIAAIRY